MEKKKNSSDKDILLAEYQAAQESAQHHDNLIWTVTSIIWGATVVLLGLVVGYLDKPVLRFILTFVSVFGIILIIVVRIFALQFNSIRKQKYVRCQEIEALLNMHQHRTLKYAAGSQRFVYLMITILFIIFWLIVLYMIWFN